MCCVGFTAKLAQSDTLVLEVTLNPNNTKLQTLEAITIAGEVKQRERFQPIIQGVLLSVLLSPSC